MRSIEAVRRNVAVRNFCRLDEERRLGDGVRIEHDVVGDFSGRQRELQFPLSEHMRTFRRTRRDRRRMVARTLPRGERRSREAAVW